MFCFLFLLGHPLPVTMNCPQRRMHHDCIGDRQHLTCLLHFWDAMGVFVRANPSTVMMSVLVLTPTAALLSAGSKPQHESVEAETQTGSCLFLLSLHHILHLWTNKNLSLVPFFPHSDLLSSDYVEIHYEGGKPVLSKVNLFPMVTKCCSAHLVLVESASVVGSVSHAPCYLYVFKTMRIVSC